MSLTSPPYQAPASAPSPEPKPTLDRAAAAVMAHIAEDTAQQSGGKVQFASLDTMRRKSAAVQTNPEVKP